MIFGLGVEVANGEILLKQRIECDTNKEYCFSL